MDKFSQVIKAIGQMSFIQGSRPSDKKAIASVIKAEMGEEAIKDALKVTKGGEEQPSRYKFTAVADASRDLPSLEALLENLQALKNFEIGEQATKTSYILEAVMGDLESLIAYSRVVTLLSTYFILFQNAMENMHSHSTEEDRAVASATLKMLGIKFDESKRSVDWTKKG